MGLLDPIGKSRGLLCLCELPEARDWCIRNNLSHSGHNACLGQNSQKRLFLKPQNPLAHLPGAILLDFIISAGFDVAIAVPPDFGAYKGAGFFGAL